MYQNENINQNTFNIKEILENKLGKLKFLTNIYEKKNLAIYIIALMLSLVSGDGQYSIFSISILGACFSTGVPAIGIIVISLIGNLIRYGTMGALGYFLSVLTLVVSMLIFKPKYNENGRNEKIKIGKNIILSMMLVQIVQFAITGFTIYDILSSVTLSIIALVFYKIFVNSIVVLQDFREKRAFSIEEVIGASILLSIAVTAFGDLNILGFSIRNILSILIVMILGWKNGILVGTTAGVTIGVTLGVITGTEPIMIAAYAISGMIAGILNKFGKIGVIVGFILGNIVLAYVSNGYTTELILFNEILIASIGLLVIPRGFTIDLEEFVGNSKFLPPVPNRALNRNREMAENLNNVSEAIQEMATTYKAVENSTFGENTETNANKHIFMAELLNNLEPYRENMLYQDVVDMDGKISQNIFLYLLDKQEIDKEVLINIFKESNNYIVEFEDKKTNKVLEENIAEIVRTVNLSYRISKTDFIWRKKVEQNKKVIHSQLNKVSSAISKMADEMKEDIKEEQKYGREKVEISELLKQKNILVEDIYIKKTERYILEIYTEQILETSKVKVVENIVSKVLKETIVINDQVSENKKLALISDDKYVMAFGTAKAVKSESEMSGDNILNLRLKDGKQLIAISDGMGTGRDANKSSKHALSLLENLLISGFDKDISLDLINGLLMNQSEEIFATLDIAILDLYAGKVEFIKSGACPTYIKTNKKVQVISSDSLPSGIIEDAEVQSLEREIQTGELMFMCTDGVIDSNIEYKNKELWIKYILEDIETTNTNKIADLILNEAIDNNFGLAKDDMSIIVIKINEK